MARTQNNQFFENYEHRYYCNNIRFSKNVTKNRDPNQIVIIKTYNKFKKFFFIKNS